MQPNQSFFLKATPSLKPHIDFSSLAVKVLDDIFSNTRLYHLHWRIPRWLSVKNPPANVGDMGSIPGSESALEEEMAIHSSILPWKNPMDRAAWWATQSMGLQRVGHDWAHTCTHVYTENPLFSGATFINELARSSEELASASTSALAASLCALILWKWLLSLDLINKSLLTSNIFFCSFLTSCSLHRIEES